MATESRRSFLRRAAGILAAAAIWPTTWRRSRAATPGVIRTRRSGNWSDPRTWDLGRVPIAGDAITIGSGHTVVVAQPAVITGNVLDLGPDAGLYFAWPGTEG